MATVRKSDSYAHPCWVTSHTDLRLSTCSSRSNFEAFGVRYGLPNCITFTRTSIFPMTDLSRRDRAPQDDSARFAAVGHAWPGPGRVRLVAPVFFLLLFGIIEGGRFIFYHETLNNATREGARYAIVHGCELVRAPAGRCRPMHAGVRSPCYDAVGGEGHPACQGLGVRGPRASAVTVDARWSTNVRDRGPWRQWSELDRCTRLRDATPIARSSPCPFLQSPFMRSRTLSSTTDRSDERGQILVLFAGGLVALFIIAALAFDVGSMLPGATGPAERR